MKIIVTESIAKEGIEQLQNDGFEVDVRFGISAEELLDIIQDYDAIIVRSVTQVNKQLMDKGSKLKVVGRAGNGVDNIDLQTATDKGIIVVNTPESNSMAAAELAVGHAYAIFRNIVQAVTAGKNDDFRRGKFIGSELDGKTAGIIGLGRIGSIVANKLKGSNMKVIAYDPYVSDDKFDRLGVRRCHTLDDLLKDADLITIHTPKNSETVNIINAAELAKCKDGVRIVNAARGGLVNEDALYDALVSGKVAACALDVLNPEPNYNKAPGEQNYQNKLLTLPNCIVTPHLGASTKEANYNVGMVVTKLVGMALEGQVVQAVNMPSVAGKDFNEMKPFIKLAEALGCIYYQTENPTLEKLEITYYGDIAEDKAACGIYTLSVIKGLLEPVCATRINYVNAEAMLEQAGVKYSEKFEKSVDKFQNVITVTFVSSEKTLSVSGTVFAQSEIRIVDFYGYKVNFEPTAHVIALQNRDIPGMIGKIGTVLGDHGINIAAVQWSGNDKGEKAEALVSVDQEVSDDIFNVLKSLDGVLKASRIKFFG
ncbi:MAG: phosphoglycerate dehydrogenase [Ruminococcaceae bacterium]|nr:phosphoglycerate dehydrogenase [Oscillospiraceae bacterium]